MPVKLPHSIDWPRGSRLYLYDENMLLIEESADRKFDLHDALFQAWPENHRRAHIGLEIRSRNWPVWNEKALRWVESRIVWDFTFDGDQVKLRRRTRQKRRPCTEEFVWQVDLR